MAVKWAVANGNWNDGATWNDGVVPTIDDDVYLNGYNITHPNAMVYLTAKNITNGLNPNTNRQGGTIIGGYSYSGQTTKHFFVSANIVCDAVGLSFFGSLTVIQICHINGNVVVANGGLTALSGSQNRTIEVNGNVTCADILGATTGTFNITVNGNLSLSADCVCTAATIVNLHAEYCLLRLTTLNIRGSITYKSTNNTMGVRYTTLNILNPDTFTWKDVTEPRSNPFIIVTDAEMNNRQQYPSEDVVKQGVEYVWGEKVGTYQQPPESVVLKGFVYDNGDKVGSLENQNIVGCVTKEDVREGVPLLGMGENGTLVVPSADDVREGVVFDNGSVGTLIVEGGGDRLRIADFGYYTNAQSDTYIVDLTEQDKPKFAVAEERVLIEMFPELDLDNIPEKYFDDLFAKYLKYRLIVEYYRTAGINSTFTTSEPTTEIVNYRNVNCEIWMNIANTYLKAWGTKYPNSIKKQRILL